MKGRVVASYSFIQKPAPKFVGYKATSKGVYALFDDRQRILLDGLRSKGVRFDGAAVYANDRYPGLDTLEGWQSHYERKRLDRKPE